MKYAVYYDTYLKLTNKEKENVCDILYYYSNILEAVKAMNNVAKDGKRFVFEISGDDLVYRDRKHLTKELQQLQEIDMATAIILPKPFNFEGINNIIFDVTFAVSTIQQAMTLKAMGASEVYVTGSLAANLEELNILSKRMKLRMIPNFVQTDGYSFGSPAGIDPLSCFWVRPEGMDLYKDVISTVELAYDDTHDEEELFLIYNRKEWIGDLGQIIIDHTGTLNDINSRLISPGLDIVKANCGLKCQVNNSCSLCKELVLARD